MLNSGVLCDDVIYGGSSKYWIFELAFNGAISSTSCYCLIWFTHYCRSFSWELNYLSMLLAGDGFLGQVKYAFAFLSCLSSFGYLSHPISEPAQWVWLALLVGISKKINSSGIATVSDCAIVWRCVGCKGRKFTICLDLFIEITRQWNNHKEKIAS